MNKKLLFAAMSLAALTACTNDDFESKNVAQQEVSPIQFEVINNAETRASMGGTNGNTLVWNANDNDLFTLYHGATIGSTDEFENAIFKANKNEQGATLTTPSMIKAGGAIMVWPVDTTFRIKYGDKLTITIPDVQIPNAKGDVSDIIPYTSDLVNIDAYAEYDEAAGTDYNTAGYTRKYPVYMRPMASLLTLKAEYGETENNLKKLYEGGTDPLIDGDPITPITVTSVSLLTNDGGATKFTKTIPVKFTDPSVDIAARWAAATGKNANNAWAKVTDFDIDNITTPGYGGEQVATLTSKCLAGNESSKFLILPQKAIAAGDPVEMAAVEVNTYYGKVLIAKQADYAESKYEDAEYDAAWYRYISAAQAETANENASSAKITSGEFKDKYKVVAKSTALGMAQTLNSFSSHTVGSGLTQDEPSGYSLTRYLNVNLSHLDMSDLHIKDDKQLRDVARVWKKLGLDPVTVYLDGDDNEEFAISQKTIKVINSINTAIPTFKVQPCVEAGEECNTIVITGGGDVQDMAFITYNDVDASGDLSAGDIQAKVVFNEGETWKWKGTVKVEADGVFRIYNKGTMVNDVEGESTLKTVEADGTQNDVRLVNLGTWNITKGTLFVQFDVTNQKTMEISKGAEYRQDGTGHIFYNWANALPTRFGGDDTVNGEITNKGVFATVNGGKIYNQALIEHADVDAKTYISYNEVGGNFGAPFSGANKMGRINLPYSNKMEDNVSITSTLDKGFVSVTVDGEVTGALDASVLGTKVNYVIIKSGVTEINKVAGTVKYLEINEPGTEIAWKVSEDTSYDGLMILSKVNITQGTNVTVNEATYLGATMYVGGIFTNASWSGYYGDTTDAFATKYVTY